MGDLIDRIAADQWTAPTACAEWSVRDVINHLVGMNLVFAALLEESRLQTGRHAPRRYPGALNGLTHMADASSLQPTEMSWAKFLIKR